MSKTPRALASPAPVQEACSASFTPHLQRSAPVLDQRGAWARRGWSLPAVLGTVCAALLAPLPTAQATSLTVSEAQRATANDVATKGVPLSELAPNAPERHTVKSGDTLWAISSLFLKSPWRWPELWGMNIKAITNPHRIYPGQVLVLVRVGDRAMLTVESSAQEGQPPADIPVVKVTPRTRMALLEGTAIPTLKNHLIEPFLAEPMIVDKTAFDRAPRFVATQEGRVLLSRGDRAYARSVYEQSSDDAGQASAPIQLVFNPGKPRTWRIYRDARPIADPTTGQVLGYEAPYLGRAELVRPESPSGKTADGKTILPTPATLDIVFNKEEIRTGDRLLPEPPRGLQTYTPRAPHHKVDARIASVYGSAVALVSTNQVVTINQGSQQGLEPGHVLAIQKAQVIATDKTDPDKPDMALPVERNGLLMVFLSFERLSYALVLSSTDGVKIGDRLVNPR